MSNSIIELTSREHDVLQLLSQGLNSGEIAQTLYISVNTVEYHRKRLLRKMSAKNAAHLVGNAFRMRLLKD